MTRALKEGEEEEGMGDEITDSHFIARLHLKKEKRGIRCDDKY